MVLEYRSPQIERFLGWYRERRSICNTIDILNSVWVWVFVHTVFGVVPLRTTPIPIHVLPGAPPNNKPNRLRIHPHVILYNQLFGVVAGYIKHEEDGFAFQTRPIPGIFRVKLY